MSNIDKTKNIDALVFYNYHKLYLEFEKLLKDIFVNNINSSDNNSLVKWFYYVGFLHSTAKYIKTDEDIINKIETHTYSDNLISQLTLSNIVKISRFDNSMFQSLSQVEIPLIQKKIITKKIFDCATIFIDVRNKLAHKTDLSDIDLNPDKFSIEILSEDSFNNNKLEWMSEIYYEETSSQQKCLISNCIYLDRIIKQLKETKYI